MNAQMTLISCRLRLKSGWMFSMLYWRKMSRFLYFKGSRNQSQLMEGRERPFTSSEITHHFGNASAAIWADLYSFWIWQTFFFLFFFPIPWECISAGTHFCSFYSSAWISSVPQPLLIHLARVASGLSHFTHVYSYGTVEKGNWSGFLRSL